MKNLVLEKKLQKRTFPKKETLYKLCVPHNDDEKMIDKKEINTTELQKRQATLQRYADKGALNERGQSTLMQLNQMLEQALASAAHGGFIDKPLMGRSRDI